MRAAAAVAVAVAVAVERGGVKGKYRCVVITAIVPEHPPMVLKKT